MASAAQRSDLTPEEYLARERLATFRSEYHEGKIRARSGGSRSHNLLAASLCRHIGNQIVGSSCELYIADMKVRVARTKSYYYPDIVIVCGGPRFEDDVTDVLLNPTVVVEILSPSTERFDRGGKFAGYREIDSLYDYVLVSQEQILVERYTRREDSWIMTFFRQEDDILRLPSIGCEVALKDIYAGVPLADAEPDPRG